MTPEDFALYHIDKFTAQEITSTGAKLSDISALLFANLNGFRNDIGASISLIANGLTTGNHKSKEHAEGKAVDCYLKGGDLCGLSIATILFLAVKNGFKGFGIYFNGSIYSFHLDLRPAFSAWTAFKHPEDSDWTYSRFVNDPQRLYKGVIT